MTFLVPFMLGYTVFVYHTFRGRSAPARVSLNLQRTTSPAGGPAIV